MKEARETRTTKNKQEGYIQQFNGKLVKVNGIYSIRLNQEVTPHTPLKNEVLHYLKGGYHTTRKQGVILPPTWCFLGCFYHFLKTKIKNCWKS